MRSFSPMDGKILWLEECVSAMCRITGVPAVRLHCGGRPNYEVPQSISYASTSFWKCQISARVSESSIKSMGDHHTDLLCALHKLFWWLCGAGWCNRRKECRPHGQSFAQFVRMGLRWGWTQSPSVWRNCHSFGGHGWCDPFAWRLRYHSQYRVKKPWTSWDDQRHVAQWMLA